MRSLATIAIFAVLPALGCGYVGLEELTLPPQHPDAGDDAASELDADAPSTGDANELADRSDDPLDATEPDDGATDLDSDLVGDAGSSTQDAGPVGDGSAQDAGALSDSGTRDAGPLADSGPPDAGTTVPPGTRVLVDHSAGSEALADHAIRFLLDTRAAISAGSLSSDCSNLRVWGGTGCAAQRAYFLPAYGCNSNATEVWVRVPQLSAGASEVLRVSFDGGSTGGSDGNGVFSFFDDFDGNSLNRSRWTTTGVGSVSVSGGQLHTNSVILLESEENVVSAGQDVVGARIAAAGQYDTDVELGVGHITNADPRDAWAHARVWEGFTFLSFDYSTHAFGAPGSPCNTSSIPPSLGQAWADRAPSTASFQTAEFAYDNVGGRTEAWLRTSRGVFLQFDTQFGCSLAARLPVLVNLDHNTVSPAVDQRIDYVYVRPGASVEPTASVMSNSSLPCGAR